MTRYEDVSSARFLRLRNRIPAPSVAQWTVDIWRQIEGILTPVFGSNVVALLYEKSLQAAKATYPWLPSGPQLPDEPPAMLLVDLKRALTTRSPAEAIDGVALMLQSFSCLLESLIGKALASRMLILSFGCQETTTSRAIELTIASGKTLHGSWVVIPRIGARGPSAM